LVRQGKARVLGEENKMFHSPFNEDWYYARETIDCAACGCCVDRWFKCPECLDVVCDECWNPKERICATCDRYYHENPEETRPCELKPA